MSVPKQQIRGKLHLTLAKGASDGLLAQFVDKINGLKITAAGRTLVGIFLRDLIISFYVLESQASDVERLAVALLRQEKAHALDRVKRSAVLADRHVSLAVDRRVRVFFKELLILFAELALFDAFNRFLIYGRKKHPVSK